MEKIQSIFPVIVLYGCRLRDSKAYRSFIAKYPFRQFMVYDNSPASIAEDSDVQLSNAVLVRDIHNGGVSKAYNVASTYAAQHNFQYLLLLDQDTEFPEMALSVYLQHLHSQLLCAPMLTTMDGYPFSPSSKRGFRTRAVKLPSGKYSLNTYMPVNSGMLIPLSLFQKCGGYDESVKLDFSDYVFLSHLKEFSSEFVLLPLVAFQDFSNHEKAVSKLQSRFVSYLQSARATKWNTTHETFMLWTEVICHTFALSLRTKSFVFLRLFFEKFFKPRIFK